MDEYESKEDFEYFDLSTRMTDLSTRMTDLFTGMTDLSTGIQSGSDILHFRGSYLIPMPTYIDRPPVEPIREPMREPMRQIISQEIRVVDWLHGQIIVRSSSASENENIFDSSTTICKYSECPDDCPSECIIELTSYKDDDNVAKTICKHYFLESSLRRWVSINSTCPICRCPIALLLEEESYEDSDEDLDEDSDEDLDEEPDEELDEDPNLIT